jgi:hypothetical protein
VAGALTAGRLCRTNWQLHRRPPEYSLSIYRIPIHLALRDRVHFRLGQRILDDIAFRLLEVGGGPDLEIIDKISSQIEATVREVPGTRSAYAERVQGP